MKNYDLIIIGTGSAMNLINPYLEQNPDAKVAVIDKDEPGGICLNKGCIPTKILLYPADIIRLIENAKRFGIDAKIDKIRFRAVMERMRAHIFKDMNGIRESLRETDVLDYYEETASFTAPYTLQAGDNKMKGKQFFLCTGSKPFIPDISGIEETGYLTSDTVLELNEAPKSLVIIGGGYIAAEYAHFFSAMGTEVTIIGRNPQFLKEEEPEISEIAAEDLGNYVTIYTGTEVIKVEKGKHGKKTVTTQIIAPDEPEDEISIETDEILVAAGRQSNSDILNPAAGGIETDENGWVRVNEYFETSQPNIWAFGDATGHYLFKHAANYESEIVYYNVIKESGDGAENSKKAADYRAVPHAVFTHPEIASVGMKESEAVEEYGEENVIIGAAPYSETGKGTAMGLEHSEYFVKVILKMGSAEILGAHIVGPQASVLIQEIVDCMNIKNRRYPFSAMHIHPALSEVVDRAFSNLMTVHGYGHFIGRYGDDHEHDHQGHHH